MKQAQKFFLQAAFKSFIFGAVTCLCFYTFIRLIFWDFQFSISEELTNLFKIVTGGGLMFTAAAILFLLAERLVAHFSLVKVAVPNKDFNTAATPNQ